MIILAKLIGDIKTIETPSTKDEKKGLRFSFIAEEKIRKTILSEEVEEVLYYQVKTQDKPDLSSEDRFILSGDSWALKPENKDHKIRGFTNPVIFKLRG